MTGGATPQVGGIEIGLPQLAENGNSVPLHVKVESAMSAEDRFKKLRRLPTGVRFP